MRQDKFTTKLQAALQESQSLALGRDHQIIEPVHLMQALLDQQGGTVRPLLDKCGANINTLRSQLREALDRLPKVEGTGGEVHLSNDLARLLNLTDKVAQKRGDQYITSELFILAALEDKGPLARILKDAGVQKAAIERAIDEIRGGSKVDDPNVEEQRGRPREIHDRSHRARGAGQARSGHRPRRRNPPHDPGAAASHQEQPRADRRAGRRQDRDRRRPRAAHHQRGSAREPARQAHPLARHGRADRGREVPRRIRGAPQGRAERSRQAGRPRHPVHRRTAHDGRRRQGRRLDGRRQHAEARARARRAALRRRHHARRIPQVRREGRRARAPLPEGAGQRAVGRGHDRDPARPEGALRGPPQGRDHRSGDRRRGHALASLHHRPAVARQGDRPDRRGRVAHPHGDGLEARGNGPARPPHHPAQDGARGAQEGEGRRVEEASRGARRAARRTRQGVRRPRGNLEGREGVGAGRRADQAGTRACATGIRDRASRRRPRPHVRTAVRQDSGTREAPEVGAGQRDEGADARPQQGDRRGNRRGRLEVDRHSGLEDARGRARKAAAHGRGAGEARRRPGRGGQGRLRCDPPFARRALRSEPAERLVPVPRSDRCRQDRAVQGARRVPLRHRRGDGAHRHVGVHGEALRRAPDRRAAGIRGLRGRRLPDGGRAPPSVRGDPARRGREGAPGRVQRAAAGARRRPSHGRAGSHRGFPQLRRDHDLEPRLAT